VPATDDRDGVVRVMSCARSYEPSWTQLDSLPSGRHINRAVVHYKLTNGDMYVGPALYYRRDGAQPCFVEGYLELLDDLQQVVGRSAVTSPTR
jgi:hypothetical protein